MAEEPKQEQEAQEPEAEEAPEAEAETPEAEEAPEAEAETPEAEEAEAQAPEGEEPEAPQPEAEEVPEAEAEEPEAEEAPAAAPDAGEAAEAEEEVTHPKAIRKLARSRASGPPKPPRSPAERAAERAERRRSSAVTRRRHRASKRAKRGEPRQGTPPAERRPGDRKVRQGTVVSSKPDKTITVAIEITRRHPTYEKVVRRSATLHAHDERNEANEGDTVRVVESRPLSKTKRWRLVEILERAR